MPHANRLLYDENWSDEMVISVKDTDIEKTKVALYDINMFWDNKANVWIALADDVPLVLESFSYDVLVERVKQAVPELLQLNSKPYEHFELRFIHSGITPNG